VQDEITLLARARALDPEALAQIHDIYYAPVLRYVSTRVGDRATGEDLTSDVFVRFLAALHDHTAPQNTLQGWLYRVASHVVSDHFRHHYRARLVDLPDGLPNGNAGPAELTEAQLTHENLRQAMAELTEEQQNTISLRYGQGLSIQETAKMMNKNEGAVKQLQARALASLARILSRMGD
jgi:RNA polymerase sigma-70 factor (ECF subfamily)